MKGFIVGLVIWLVSTAIFGGLFWWTGNMAVSAVPVEVVGEWIKLITFSIWAFWVVMFGALAIIVPIQLGIIFGAIVAD